MPCRKRAQKGDGKEDSKQVKEREGRGGEGEGEGVSLM